MVDGSTRVVIADDDALIRLVIISALHMAGCVVEEADSGTDALRLIVSTPFDVAIVDAHMPGPGLEALVRAIAETTYPPEVIILSGDAAIVGPTSAPPVSEHGEWMPTLLAKPVELEVLVDTVNRLAARARLARTVIDVALGLADEHV